jgi:hypothetical protein
VIPQFAFTLALDNVEAVRLRDGQYTVDVPGDGEETLTPQLQLMFFVGVEGNVADEMGPGGLSEDAKLHGIRDEPGGGASKQGDNDLARAAAARPCVRLRFLVGVVPPSSGLSPLLSAADFLAVPTFS